MKKKSMVTGNSCFRVEKGNVPGPKEIELVKQIAKGFTAKLIAANMKVGQPMIHRVCAEMRMKYGVEKSFLLVEKFRKNNWIK